MSSDDDVCCVCLCGHTDDSTTTGCGHIMHRRCLGMVCLAQAGNPEVPCPMCRTPLTAPPWNAVGVITAIQHDDVKHMVHADPQLTHTAPLTEGGHTALQLALAFESGAVVDHLLANGADPNYYAGYDVTPLQISLGWLPEAYGSGGSNSRLALALLSAGADPGVVTESASATPLTLSIMGRRIAVTRKLLEAGVSLEAECWCPALPEFEGMRALHIALATGNARMTALLLEHGADVEAPTQRGMTPLQLAVLLGHRTVISMLIKAGANCGAQLHGMDVEQLAGASGRRGIQVMIENLRM